MFCKNCGFQNAEGTRFCVNCGQDLTQPANLGQTNMQNGMSTPNQATNNFQGGIPSINQGSNNNQGSTPPPRVTPSNEHNSIPRKSLKKDAKGRAKGPLYGIFATQLILTVILFAILNIVFPPEVVQTEDTITYTQTGIGPLLGYLVVYIAATLLNFGFIKGTLDISRDKQTTFMDLVKYSFTNIVPFLKYIGTFLLAYLVGIVICLVPIIGIIAFLVLMFYFIPTYIIFGYRLVDENYQNEKWWDKLKNANDLAGGHRVEFYGLLFSFMGWMILGCFTLGILYIWLMPYVQVSFANYYLRVSGEREYTGEPRGLSNGLIIFLSLLSYFVAIIIIIFIIAFAVIAIGASFLPAASEDILKDNGWEIITEEGKEKDSIELSGYEQKTYQNLSFSVPRDFGEITLAGYNISYANTFQTQAVSLIVQDKTEGVDARTFASTYRDVLSATYPCTEITEKTINNTTWYVMECNDTQTTMRLYTGENANQYYVAVISYITSEKDQTFIDEVENSLKFTNAV